jgi:hypothetical protein
MSNDSTLKGLKGWLVLVSFLLFFELIFMLFFYIHYLYCFFYDLGKCLQAIPSKEFLLLARSVLFIVVSIIALIYLVYLFFSKHYLFPKLFISIVAYNSFLLYIDVWLLIPIYPRELISNAEKNALIIIFFLGALVKILYMLESKRVKATFVEKMPVREAT